jgi:hypothetical protein
MLMTANPHPWAAFFFCGTSTYPWSMCPTKFEGENNAEGMRGFFCSQRWVSLNAWMRSRCPLRRGCLSCCWCDRARFSRGCSTCRHVCWTHWPLLQSYLGMCGCVCYPAYCTVLKRLHEIDNFYHGRGAHGTRLTFGIAAQQLTVSAPMTPAVRYYQAC